MILAAVVVLVDQATKAAIINLVPLYDDVPINDFINLTHQQNTGAAFSFLAGAGGWQRWFFVVLASVVSAALVVWLWRLRAGNLLVLAAGLTLVLGGALGNLVDRIRLGYVTDFIQVWFGSWAFPSFNVADSDHGRRRAVDHRLAVPVGQRKGGTPGRGAARIVLVDRLRQPWPSNAYESSSRQAVQRFSRCAR